MKTIKRIAIVLLTLIHAALEFAFRLFRAVGGIVAAFVLARIAFALVAGGFAASFSDYGLLETLRVFNVIQLAAYFVAYVAICMAIHLALYFMKRGIARLSASLFHPCHDRV